MPVHFFHCSDGTDLVLDRSGRETPDLSAVRPQALSIAGELMRGVPDYGEWERWSVYVYDELGEVEIIPFPELKRFGADASSAIMRPAAAVAAKPRKARRSSH